MFWALPLIPPIYPSLVHPSPPSAESPFHPSPYSRFPVFIWCVTKRQNFREKSSLFYGGVQVLCISAIVVDDCEEAEGWGGDAQAPWRQDVSDGRNTGSTSQVVMGQ